MKNSSSNSQVLTVWGFVVVLLGGVLYFVSKSQFVFAALIVAVIPLLTIAHSPGKWWLAAVLLANSSLVVPGLGTNMTASLAASAGFVGLMFMERIFRRKKQVPVGWPQRFALTLTLLLVFLASYRGWGLRIFGDEMWGGMQYVQLIIGFLFFFYSRQLTLTERQLKTAVILYFTLAVLPVAVTLLSQYVPMLTVLRRIISFQDLGAADPLQMERAVSRISFVHVPATILGYLAVFLFEWKRRLSWQVVAVGFTALILAGLSGHRIALVRIGLVAVVYILLRWRNIPFSVRLKGLVAGLALLVSIYAFAPSLPLGFQRMVSVLPGVQVDPTAAYDAEGTSEWRIEMWRQMLPMVSEHFLVGRGLGFDLREAYGAYTLASDQRSHLFFIATHNYHSGPLWALIDLGGPGALLLIGFMITALIRYGRRVSFPYSPVMSAAYVVFYAILIARFISFLGIYGDDKDPLTMTLIAAVLEVISENTRRMAMGRESTKTG